MLIGKENPLLANSEKPSIENQLDPAPMPCIETTKLLQKEYAD